MKNLLKVSIVLCLMQGVAFAQTLGPPSASVNLTGPITSVGNATSIASQTGTGTKFVVDTSPTLVTPNIGVASATTLTISGATIGANAIAAGGMYSSISASGSSPGFYSYLTGDTVARVRIGMDSSDIPSLGFGAGGASTRDTFLYRSGAGALVAGTTTVLSNASLTLGSLNSAGTISGANLVLNGNGAVSSAPLLLNGTVFTGGSATTTFPAMFIQPSGTTAVTTWSTAGTGLGMNLASGFAGSFIDFHIAGGASLFNIGAGGLITSQSGALFLGSVRVQLDAGQLTIGTANDAILSRKAAASWQLGAADAAVAVAQTLRVQSVVAGTAATNGANWTLAGSLPTGTGTSGDIIIQTGVKTGSGTTQGTATTAITIKGETQEVRLPQIATDGGLTDTTVCQDTTNHGLRSGSGALGVCLGTSGRQFKTAFAPMKAGINDLMKIKLWNYRYKQGYGDNGVRMQYGPTAQDVEAVLPDLAGHDLDGNTINYDWGAFIPIMLHAIQQQQAEIVELKRKLR